jgi:hypothetical protein
MVDEEWLKMIYFGLSCVFATLLEGLLSVIMLVSGLTEGRKQEQVDGITMVKHTKEMTDINEVGETT